VSPDV